MLTSVQNWYSEKTGEICYLIFESNIVIMILKKFQDNLFRENIIPIVPIILQN